jgi:hypothetical protein
MLRLEDDLADFPGGSFRIRIIRCLYLHWLVREKRHAQGLHLSGRHNCFLSYRSYPSRFGRHIRSRDVGRPSALKIASRQNRFSFVSAGFGLRQTLTHPPPALVNGSESFLSTGILACAASCYVRWRRKTRRQRTRSLILHVWRELLRGFTLAQAGMPVLLDGGRVVLEA